MFPEIYEIKVQNPHNAKASETKSLYPLYSAGNAGSIFKAIPAALQNFMETFHILLFEVSIRASAEGFGDMSESL